MYYIDLPEIKNYEDYKRLPPNEKEKYVKITILQILKLNKNKGVTIKQISDATYFHRSTIAYHIDSLLSTGEVYKYPENSKNALYFPNGNFGDPISKKDIRMDDKIYTFFLMSNQLGKFLYIQEKQIDVYGTVIVKGGIMIPIKNKTDFLKMITEFKKTISEVVI